MNWKSFLIGLTSIFNIFGTRMSPRVQEIANKTPEQALREDWRKVLDDLNKSLESGGYNSAPKDLTKGDCPLTLKVVTYDLKKLRLWKDLKKK